MVEGTIDRHKELKEKPTTNSWFKDHIMVFTTPEQLGKHNITITESEREDFMRTTYRPYIQSVIDHTSSRLNSSDVYSCFSIFDPCLLPDKEEDLSTYGTSKLQTLINFYGCEQCYL